MTGEVEMETPVITETEKTDKELIAEEEKAEQVEGEKEAETKEEKKQKEEEELEFPAVPTDSPTREGVSEKKAFQKEQQMAR